MVLEICGMKQRVVIRRVQGRVWDHQVHKRDLNGKYNSFLAKNLQKRALFTKNVPLIDNGKIPDAHILNTCSILANI
jgi:hypothetical protein